MCLPDGTACDQISQAFPHHICTLQAIRYWWWEQPGNKASYDISHLLEIRMLSDVEIKSEEDAMKVKMLCLLR